MASIKWTIDLSVGVPELDEDHKGLLLLINELESQTAKEADEKLVRQTLNWLLRYAQTHFAREQAVMTSCHYPLLPGHIDEHRDFLDRMHATISKFDENPAETATEIRDTLISYLEDWWQNHIMLEDMQYKSFAEKDLSRSRQAAKEVRGYEIWWGSR